MKKRLQLLTLIAAAVFSGATNAALVAYNFTWQVTDVSASAGNVFSDVSQIHVGDTYTGYFSYDDAPSAAPPYNGQGKTIFASVNDFLFSWGGYEIFTNQGFEAQASAGIPFSYPRSPYQGYFSLYVRLIDTSGQTSYVSLPSSLSLGDFDVRSVFINVLGGPNYPDSSVNITGTIASLQAVPVPASLWLLSTGLVGMLGMARRKKPHN